MNTVNVPLDFAFIGHLENWSSAVDFVNAMRKPDSGSLTLQQVREVFPFIPPRDVFRVQVISKTGAVINGAYIETFIEPDKLDEHNVRVNLKKVMRAMEYSQKYEPGIVTLGGFTSIFSEGNFGLQSSGRTKFSTGNTLTAAFIVKGIEKFAEAFNVQLSRSSVLIVGATGDIGMACAHYLKKRSAKLLLCSRNNSRLKAFAGQLSREDVTVTCSDDVNALTQEADIILCVASSTDIKLEQCKKEVLICDAGYPKNLESQTAERHDIRLFHGGMGQVIGGMRFEPDYSGSFYRYSAPGIAHGCVLEAMVLAFEKRFESYSAGRGYITTDRMEEIYEMSVKHGITIAPFFNAKGLIGIPD